MQRSSVSSYRYINERAPNSTTAWLQISLIFISSAISTGQLFPSESIASLNRRHQSLVASAAGAHVETRAETSPTEAARSAQYYEPKESSYRSFAKREAEDWWRYAGTANDPIVIADDEEVIRAHVQRGHWANAGTADDPITISDGEDDENYFISSSAHAQKDGQWPYTGTGTVTDPIFISDDDENKTLPFEQATTPFCTPTQRRRQREWGSRRHRLGRTLQQKQWTPRASPHCLPTTGTRSWSFMRPASVQLQAYDSPKRTSELVRSSAGTTLLWTPHQKAGMRRR